MRVSRWRNWPSFRNSLLFQTKSMLLNFTSCLRYKAKGNMNGLMMLYKDMESCEECGDIRVMWEMIQSSRPPDNDHNTSFRRHWTRRFCFRPKETDCKS
ncbi:hypothetical protein EUGRSUZ_A00610 [Eucalyptus grandis]|uniref:Uncharacterized protein n=2 Tax=Eucalyptus grandis TaxID=71139 RepID=A0ACC3M0T7_EUCGR|nr:hypothetical protein EUGRSUZ_A00610 [Eucalyptus grandis]